MTFSSQTIFIGLMLVTVLLNINAHVQSPSHLKLSADSFFAPPPDSNRRTLKDQMFSSPKQAVDESSKTSVQEPEPKKNDSICPPCPACLLQCLNQSENADGRLALLHLERTVNFVLHSVESSSASIFIEMRPASSGFTALREFSQQAKKAPATLNQGSFSKLSDAFDSIFQKRLTAQAIIESYYGSCRVDAHANRLTDFFNELSRVLVFDMTLLLRCIVTSLGLLCVCSLFWFVCESFLLLWRRAQSFRRVFKTSILLCFSFLLVILSESVLSNYKYILAKETAATMANKQFTEANACVPQSSGLFSWFLHVIGASASQKEQCATQIVDHLVTPEVRSPLIRAVLMTGTEVTRSVSSGLGDAFLAFYSASFGKFTLFSVFDLLYFTLIFCVLLVFVLAVLVVCMCRLDFWSPLVRVGLAHDERHRATEARALPVPAPAAPPLPPVPAAESLQPQALPLVLPAMPASSAVRCQPVRRPINADGDAPAPASASAPGCAVAQSTDAAASRSRGRSQVCPQQPRPPAFYARPVSALSLVPATHPRVSADSLLSGEQMVPTEAIGEDDEEDWFEVAAASDAHEVRTARAPARVPDGKHCRTLSAPGYKRRCSP